MSKLAKYIRSKRVSRFDIPEEQILKPSDVYSKYTSLEDQNPFEMSAVSDMMGCLMFKNLILNGEYLKYCQKIYKRTEGLDEKLRFYSQFYLLVSAYLLDRSCDKVYNEIKTFLIINDHASIKKKVLGTGQGFYRHQDLWALKKWETKGFTNPQTYYIFREPGERYQALNKREDFRMIIHSVSQEYFERDDGLFSDPVKVMSKWDAISMSVIDREKSESYGPIGFVFGVEPQNIMVTGPSDLMFKNHAGNEVMQQYDCAGGDAKIKNRNKHENSGLLKKEVMRFKNKGILTPEQLMKKTLEGERNEIIVTGRAGVNIFPGLPASKPLKLLACYVMIYDKHTDYTQLHAKSHFDTERMRNLMLGCCAKHGVPILFIPGGFNK